MHLEGTFESPVRPETVWQFLLNPNQIAPCFPDLQSLDVLSSESFRAKVKVGISVVKGTMDIEFVMTEKLPMLSAKLIGRGRGIGSTIELQTGFTLAASGTGTKVGWVADVTVGGVMAGLGTKLLESTSENMVTRVLDNLKKKLDAGAPQP